MILPKRNWKACLEIATACEISNRDVLPQGFKEQQQDHFEVLEHLFQLRDKAARTGNGLFSKRSAEGGQITQKCLHDSRLAAGCLIEWLEGQTVNE